MSMFKIVTWATGQMFVGFYDMIYVECMGKLTSRTGLGFKVKN